MKVYISGAISNCHNYMERFGEAQKMLELQGYEVINPATLNSLMPPSTTFDQYMILSFAMLDMADAIYMLDGWKKSRGATMEYNRAKARGLPVLFAGEEGVIRDE